MLKIHGQNINGSFLSFFFFNNKKASNNVRCAKQACQPSNNGDSSSIICICDMKYGWVRYMFYACRRTMRFQIAFHTRAGVERKYLKPGICPAFNLDKFTVRFWEWE